MKKILDKYKAVITSILATLGVISIIGAWVLKPVKAQIIANSKSIEIVEEEHEKHCKKSQEEFNEKLKMTLAPLEKDIAHIKENMGTMENNFNEKLQKLGQDFDKLQQFLYEKL